MDAYGNGGSRFDLAHARMAQADAKRREELDRELARIGIRGNGAERYCDECGQQLARSAVLNICGKCANRTRMRLARQNKARSRLAARGIKT